jgi:serine/threonine-protein kinase
LVAAATLIGFPGEANADVPYTFFQNNGTGHCLDSNWVGEAYTLECNGGNYQNWRTSRLFDNVYLVIDNQTDRCLDSDGAGRVYTSPC